MAGWKIAFPSRTPVDDVIMDEFHYYSDHSRGAAWQIPLLTLPRARFLLMSATLGDSSFFSKQLTDLTGSPTTLVQSNQRPVPLKFEYSTTQLQEKVAELNEQGRSPVYLVHFTQNACADTARDLLSTNFCTKVEKQAIARALDDADFRSPYGRELSKILRHGVGIHHAGLLPKSHRVGRIAENSRPRDLFSLSRVFHGGISSMNRLN